MLVIGDRGPRDVVLASQRWLVRGLARLDMWLFILQVIHHVHLEMIILYGE